MVHGPRELGGRRSVGRSMKNDEGRVRRCGDGRDLINRPERLHTCRDEEWPWLLRGSVVMHCEHQEERESNAAYDTGALDSR